MTTARILIVDDENLVALSIQNGLEQAGYSVIGLAASGQEGVALAAETQPDLVLVDLHLSGPLDGPNAADQIRDLYDIPVVFLAASADEDLLRRAHLTSPYGYLVQHFHGDDLRRTLDMALYQHAQDKKLKESEARYRGVFNLSPALTVVSTLTEGRCLEINDAGLPITGYRREEFVGRTLAELKLWADPADYAHLLQECRARGAIRNAETHLRRKSGEVFPALVSMVTVQVEGIPSVISSITDNSDRKLTEAALDHERALLRQVIDQDPNLIFVKDDSDRYLLVNHKLAELFGTTPEQMKDKTSLDLGVRPDEAARYHQRDLEVLRSGAEKLIPEGQVSLPSGEVRYFRTVLRPLGDEAGLYTRVLAVSVDITEHKQAEAALLEGEARFRSILENVPIGMFQSTLEGKFIYINPALSDMLGYASPDELIQAVDRASIADVIYADPARRPLLLEQIEQSDTHWSIFENRYRCKDGRTIDAILSLGDRADPLTGKQYLYGFVQDITERKQGEAALQELNTRLEQRVAARTVELSARTAQLDEANHELSGINEELHTLNAELSRALRSRGEFLASMSHELRTPLTGILGFSEALQMDIYGPLNDKQRQALKTVRDSGEHLLALITDILDLAKTEAGKLELQRMPVSVAQVCQASLQMIRGQANQKLLRLALSLDPAVTRLEADERRLKQILVNLLGNAVKFTPAGGEIGLEVTGDAEHDLARFVVWDTGIGIAPDMMPRLFKPFVQLDNRLNRQHAGTGLGLALTRELVQLHGGSITLESTGLPGQGSRFTVSLPWLAQPQASKKAPPALLSGQPEASDEAVHRPQPVSGRLLVADDNATTLAILQDALSARGYAVTVAHDGTEAWMQAHTTHPSLMIVDIQMPGLDGLEVIRRARSDPALTATPIIAVTALAMPGDRERCLEAGANEYLSKPVNLNILLKAIETHLELSHPLPANKSP